MSNIGQNKASNYGFSNDRKNYQSIVNSTYLNNFQMIMKWWGHWGVNNVHSNHWNKYQMTVSWMIAKSWMLLSAV